MIIVLLFEVMNEPNTNLVANNWNTFFKMSLSEIRRIIPPGVSHGHSTLGWPGRCTRHCLP